MKEYDHVIVWLDYFNRVLTRSRGRRLGREVCVPDPTLVNLIKAVEMAGFTVAETNGAARYPRRPYAPSGYVAVVKTAPQGPYAVQDCAQTGPGYPNRPGE